MKKVCILALVAMLSVMLAGNAMAMQWKVSHVRPQGTAIDKDLNQFAEEMDKATGGKIKVKVYPANALGDYTVVQERVGVGAIDMACQPVATAVDKRFNILYFPYLVKDWEQAKKNFGAGAPLRNTVAGLYAKQGIRVLAAWPVYFGGVSLVKKPEAPGDPTVSKGMKLRVPPIKTFQLLANSIGYMATPLPFSEAFTAVQTGVVDGVIGSGAEGYYASFRDVTKYYVPINTHFEVWYLIANEEVISDLDAETLKEVEKVAQDFENRRWETVQADQARNEKRLEEAGAEIIQVTPEQLSKTAEIVKEKVWPEIISDVGQEWGQKVLDNIIQ